MAITSPREVYAQGIAFGAVAGGITIIEPQPGSPQGPMTLPANIFAGRPLIVTDTPMSSAWGHHRLLLLIQSTSSVKGTPETPGVGETPALASGVSRGSNG